MQVDSSVEPLVREAFAAIVKKDTERLARALTVLGDPETATAGYRLAAAIAFQVLHEQYRGRPPVDEIRAVAGDVAELEDWTDLTAGEVETFIAGYGTGAAVDTLMPVERAVLVSYVLAANLLASYHRDGEWWFDYLDRVEAALEATS